jgi:hypothetical protein
MITNDSLPRGVALSRSQLGGYAVEWNGKFIGWIHPSVGDKWNAYVRSTKQGNSTGTPLGRFIQNEAVRQIAIAAGWPGTAGDPA